MDYQSIQVEREKEAIEGGIRRYRAAFDRDPAAVPVGARTIGLLMDAASVALDAWVKDTLAGKAVRGKDPAKLAAEFDPRSLAYLALKVILEQTKEGPVKLTRVAFRLADLSMAQRRLDKIRRDEPLLSRKLARSLRRNRDNYAIVTARRAELWAGKNSEAQPIRWTRSEKYAFGRSVIELVANATGFAVVVNWITGKNRQETRVKLTDEAFTALREAHDRMEILSPIDGPMVCPPLPWRSLMRGHGGFLTPGMARHAVRAPRRVVKELNSGVSEQVLRSLNAVQATPWAINTRVLEVAVALWDRDLAEAGAPNRENEPLPPVNGIERGTDEWKDAMKERARTHDRNSRKTSKAVAWQMALNTAAAVAEYPSIYFVHTLDFRGRIYPASSYLSPQGNDLQRGLLTFAEGAPLGDNGRYWLAVHGANSFGIDKVPFDERVQWVQDNEQAILAVAADPVGNLWWASGRSGTDYAEASSPEATAAGPFQFLAFCLEWARLYTAMSLGTTHEDFVSSLPVSFDGSCNGLQHFAAMLRDEQAARLVNLLPTEAPTDVYRAVADEAVRLIGRNQPALPDALKDHRDAFAEAWGPVLASTTGRAVCKRNTMTVPYAVSDFGMADQLKSDLGGILEGTEWEAVIDTNDERETLRHARYLAALNRAAIDSQVASAKGVMQFVRKIATVLAKSGQPLRWVTPIGMPVLQNYVEQTEARAAHILVLGRKVSPVIRVPTDTISVREQDTGAAPNFVHSMDASHLMATVDMCLDAGVTSFAMVHDSYGAPAGHADKLRAAIADAFVWQYQDHDVLEALLDGARTVLSDEAQLDLPALPQRGGLDLTAIRQAEYFFA